MEGEMKYFSGRSMTGANVYAERFLSYTRIGKEV
jgi:hypothetical protein